MPSAPPAPSVAASARRARASASSCPRPREEAGGLGGSLSPEAAAWLAAPAVYGLRRLGGGDDVPLRAEVAADGHGRRGVAAGGDAGGLSSRGSGVSLLPWMNGSGRAVSPPCRVKLGLGLGLGLG